MKSVMNFILKIFELLKSDPKTTIAKYIFFGGIGLRGIGQIVYEFSDKDVSHTLTFSDGIDYTGYLLVFIGIVLLMIRFFTIKNNSPTLAYGIGMENMDIHLPLKAIPSYERYDCIELSIPEINSYDKNEVLEIYKFIKTLINSRVENKNSQKVYIGALGSFPYLFLLGTLFRNAYSHIQLLDYDRHASGGGKWYKLPPYNESTEKLFHKLTYEDKSIEEKIHELIENELDEVGIALSYTFPINKKAIPEYLRTNILYLEHTYGIGHDKLSNEEAQRNLINELSKYISLFADNGKKIHLFVSAQSSICINIGKSYMNNSHGTLILHNYDSSTIKYNWNIKFNKNNID
ncbi:MAG: SAVED domain-containing protein [Halarcobacter sp.]